MLDPKKIKILRLRANLTLGEAARKAGWSSANCRTLWHDIEAGLRRNPTVETAQKIANALDCTIDDILAEKMALTS